MNSGIRQDYLSKGLTALAAFTLVFLGTFGTTLLLQASFIVILILVAFALNSLYKIEFEDINIDKTESRSIILYGAISLGVIVSMNFLVPKSLSIFDLSQVPVGQLSIVSMSLGVLIAVGEEQYFRGFGLNLMLTKLPYSFMAILASAALFTVYHLNVYGSSLDSMIIVLGGGLVLGFAAVQTKRVSTVMLPHILVNVLAGI